MKDSNPTLSNLTITENNADYWGGGIYMKSSNPRLSNLTITYNTANYGAGIFINADSSPSLRHLTITENTSYYTGGAIYLNDNSTSTLINSILWENSATDGDEIMTASSSSLEVSHSLLDEEFSASKIIDGGNNISGDTDPMFLDPDNNNYILQVDSLAVDSATKDLDGDGADDITDYFGLAPDMGSYEFDPCPNTPEDDPDSDGDGCGDEEGKKFFCGDFDKDYNYSIFDVMAMIQKILSPLEDTSEECYMSSDLNQNNLTTIADLIILINYVLVPGRRPQTRDCFCLED